MISRMVTAEWVSAGAAVISAVLAGVAWWSASRSKAAKQAAEQASEQAARSVVAAEAQVTVALEQVKVLERMADQAAGPEFWLEPAGRSMLRLSTRLPEVIVTGLDNLPHSRFELKSTPVTVTASQPITLISEASMASPHEDAVRLRIEGRTETVSVPLPSGSA